MSDEPRGPVDALVVPRFAGPSTFARLPRMDQVERCDVAIVGIPFDSGVTYRPGARFGPMAVRAGSRLIRPYHLPLDVEPFADQQVADGGLLQIDRSVHVGIRGPLFSRSDVTEDGELGFAIVQSADMDALGPAGAAERIRERVGDRPVYVSIDIDVLDPSHAPCTGTP